MALQELDRSPQGPHSALRWTRARYHRLIEAGVLGEDEKIELIGGALLIEGMVDRMGQGSDHFTAVGLAQDILAAIFGPGHVRVRGPLAIGSDGEPEPDIAVVSGDRREYANDHPTSALLVVEVAESTVRFDRTTKASLYASAQIPEYWLVNLPDRAVEVHREPVPDAAEPFGHRYGTILRLTGIDRFEPVAAAGHQVAVADLLP